MIFWDTSALVPLLVRESESPLAEEIARRDGRMIVWWGTPVEALSAIARREREGRFSDVDADDARAALGIMAQSWSEVVANDPVRVSASRLLRRHALRAADALQLAAALTWARGQPEGHSVFTLDERLSDAARREGFDLAAPRRR